MPVTFEDLVWEVAQIIVTPILYMVFFPVYAGVALLRITLRKAK